MTYILSQDTEDDLVDIYNYSFAEWGQDQADIYLSGLYECFGLLGVKPLLGRPRTELGDHVRSHLFKSHAIYYMPWKDGVAIIRVLHQARDVDSAFSESTQSFTGGR